MGNPVAFFRIEVKPYIIPRYSQIVLKSFSSRDEQEQILGGVVIPPLPPSHVTHRILGLKVIFPWGGTQLLPPLTIMNAPANTNG